MDTGLIIVIAIAAVALIALIALLGKRRRATRLEERRVEAREHHEEARISGARAERATAEAEERAARARREQAVADEQATAADRERRFARDRHERAVEVDPDRDEVEEPDRGARR
jgi:hypothetical protein